MARNGKATTFRKEKLYMAILTEKDRQLLATLEQLLPGMTDNQRARLQGFCDGLAFNAGKEKT